MSEWKEYKLGEICKVKGGKRLPKGNNLTTIPNSHPYIRVRDMGEKYLPINNLEYVPNEVFPSIKNYIVDKGDLILSIVGSVGLVSLVNENLDKASLTENCVKILPQKEILNNEFLYYFLISNFGQAEIYKKTVGAVQPKLPIYNINDIELNLPNLQTQTAIVEVLSSLDDKIELNNKINQELETLTQTLFKQWFIDFEFPNENGEPYKSSGGEMTDTELGEIPKEWDVEFLSNLFDFLEGPGLRNWQYRLEGMPFINIRLIQDGDIRKNNISYISIEEFKAKYQHFSLKENDLVLSTSGTLGKSAIVRKNHLPLMLNTSVIRFRPIESFCLSYMYQFLQSKIFIDEVKASATGSVQLNFGPVHLKKIKLVKPSEIILKQFEDSFSIVYSQIQQLRNENDELVKTRNYLLPKLISGELEINEIYN